MEEETTTSAPIDTGGQTIQGIAVDDQGMAVPQPEDTEPAQADSTTIATEEQEPSTTNEPSDDEQLVKFAESKGLTLDSDSTRKAAKMAMNAERAMHQKAQKASELERAANITPDQVPEDATPEVRDNLRVRNLELRYDVQQWKQLNPDKLEHESAMVEVLSDPTKRALVQEGLLSLDDVYSMARANDLGAVKSEGKREALTDLAQRQQTAVPTGNAVNPSGGGAAKITPQNVDSLVAQNDVKWFQANYEAINKAMAG